MMHNSPDKAGLDYWDKTWEDASVPALFNPEDLSVDNHFHRQVHLYLKKIVAGRAGLKVLEIGCAQSIWPEYFKTYHGIDVDGLDYSEIGCVKTRQIWAQRGLTGKIICADMFAPPSDMLGQYDLVMSFGVVEHFEDTSACLKAAAAFINPGGRVLTMIPNLAGVIGDIQKLVDRRIYDIHVPLTEKALKRAHDGAELDVLESGYMTSINLSIVNSVRHAGKKGEKLLRRALSVPTKLIWMAERAGVPVPVIPYFSPYIFTLARPRS